MRMKPFAFFENVVLPNIEAVDDRPDDLRDVVRLTALGLARHPLLMGKRSPHEA